MTRSIAGPSFKIDGGSLPCGCRVGHDEGKLRLWYCPTHASAFEMLEALRLDLSVLDAIVERAPAMCSDLSGAMDASMRTRKVIRKATAGVWS